MFSCIPSKTEGSKHAGLLDQLFETFAGRDQNDKMHESQNEERGDKDHPDHIDKSMLAHESRQRPTALGVE